jgi:hypothetical protein
LPPHSGITQGVWVVFFTGWGDAFIFENETRQYSGANAKVNQLE